jgi:hypothetical protein
VNSGRPVWHVSIARLGGNGSPISTHRWGEGVFRAARRLAAETLDGVGSGESIELVKPVCVHVRRSLTLAEVATLSAEWLAIPARDEFDESGAVETRL